MLNVEIVFDAKQAWWEWRITKLVIRNFLFQDHLASDAKHSYDGALEAEFGRHNKNLSYVEENTKCLSLVLTDDRSVPYSTLTVRWMDQASYIQQFIT